MTSKYCSNCGATLIPEDDFCSACGNQVQGGGFKQLSNFQQTQPMMIQNNFEPLENYGIINATKAIHLNPEISAPQLLNDPMAPNPTIWVILFGFLSGLFSALITIKTEYEYSSDIPQNIIDANNQQTSIGIIGVTVVTSIISIFFAWIIGSWILAKLMQKGFPFNSTLSFDAVKPIRRLTGYRYATGVFAILIRIIVLALSPNQVITYSMGNVLGTSVPIPTVTSSFGSFYTITLVITGLIYFYYASVVLYKGAKANGYTGFWVNIVIGANVIFVVFPLLSTLSSI